MWHPDPCHRHAIRPARWPSAAEAGRSLLFSPLSAGRLRLNARTWVPAMVPWRASEDGFVTAELLEWYERFAAGSPGAIVIEATGIRDIPSGPLLRIGHDRFIPLLRQLVQRIKDASAGHTRVFIQLIDFLAVKRRPSLEAYFHKFLRVTDRHRDLLSPAVRTDDEIRATLTGMDAEALARILTPRELEDLNFGYRERVTDIHLPHIRALPRILPGVFADAAARAEAAGFDGVELHYAHAYTMASFLSALNTRDDGYGGTRTGRIRLPLEVFQAVRDRVSHQFVVGCRYLTDEIVADGSTLGDATAFGVEFARAGFDFLSVSRGGKFEDAKRPQVGWAVYPYTGESGWECMPTVLADEQGPFGRNVEAAATIRKAVRAAGLHTPIVVSGGIHEFDQAERILEDGEADVVGAARQSLADPDWFLKIRLGRGEEVRRCTFTNYCEGLDQKHKQVTCKLWDRVAVHGGDAALSHDGKRRLTAPAWSARLQCSTQD
jgi:2,4-dienoyl-CoA reductase-like NADH-dependent reductase (Old Yellow Enzyme family)